MNDDRRRWVMEEAIVEAAHSQSEDTRIHPKVGALLVTRDLEVVARAHRNEIAQCNPHGAGGDHAERILLFKAEQLSLPVAELILVVTLEPCTWRPRGTKVPCAQRVRLSGIRELWFGTLDPDPAIRGVGEETLRRSGITVERFPNDLIHIVRKQSATFVEQFAPYYQQGERRTATN